VERKRDLRDQGGFDFDPAGLRCAFAVASVAASRLLRRDRDMGMSADLKTARADDLAAPRQVVQRTAREPGSAAHALGVSSFRTRFPFQHQRPLLEVICMS
jgi:hypothetical protein